MVYLNGKKVQNDAIDPAKHIFIGCFRPPSPPASNWPISEGAWRVIACPCGDHLWTVKACHEHWRDGHLDVPQYIDIVD